MKTHKLALWAFFLMAVTLWGTMPAFAVTFPGAFYPVADNGGTANGNVPKDTYNFGETPYLKLYVPSSAADFTISLLHQPNGSIQQGTQTYNIPGSIYSEKWFSLVNPFNWNDPSVQGNWTAQATYYDSGWVNNYANFTITPEPLATVLFVLGGAPIALNIYRKRKSLKPII